MTPVPVRDSQYEGSCCNGVLQVCGPGRVPVSRQTRARGLAGQQDMLEVLEGQSLQVEQHRGSRGLVALPSSNKSSQTCSRCWIKGGLPPLKTWTCSTQASSSTDWTRVVRLWGWHGLIISLLHPTLSIIQVLALTPHTSAAQGYQMFQCKYKVHGNHM
jgi:hypothetical protein